MNCMFQLVIFKNELMLSSNSHNCFFNMLRLFVRVQSSTLDKSLAADVTFMWSLPTVDH